MNDVIYRINYVLLKNKALKLKKENEDKDKKILEFSDECKKIISTSQYNSANKINELFKINANLKSENERLLEENSYLKKSLNRIPKFILQIFKIHIDKNIFS